VVELPDTLSARAPFDGLPSAKQTAPAIKPDMWKDAQFPGFHEGGVLRVQVNKGYAKGVNFKTSKIILINGGYNFSTGAAIFERKYREYK
jgi:hypothetical protein